MQNNPKKPYAEQGKILRQIRECFPHKHRKGPITLETFIKDYLNSGYSKSAVSKWETGEVVPNNNVLQEYEKIVREHRLDVKIPQGGLQSLYELVHNGPKPEGLPITEDLTWHDVEHAVPRLKDMLFVDRFTPLSMILGVNRGGGVTGGLLAKAMGVPLLVIPCERWSLDSSQSPVPPALIDMLERSHNPKLLVVDDCYRTGHMMNAGLTCLGDLRNHVQIKTAVILNETHPERETHPDFYVYTTETSGLGPPWEVKSQYN